MHVQLHFFLGPNDILLYGYTTFIYPFTSRWMFEWFPLLGSNLCYGAMNIGARTIGTMNIHVQIFVCTCFHFSWVYNSEKNC